MIYTFIKQWSPTLRCNPSRLPCIAETNNGTKKRTPNFFGVQLILAVSTFPGRLQPSIIDAAVLTSVFEMGTGVSLQLYPPENF